MNAKPGEGNAGAGDQYEDENRLSPQKRALPQYRRAADSL
jgi:hypothetical protein